MTQKAERISGPQDPKLEKPLPPNLQKYVEVHPWKPIQDMRRAVLDQLIEVTEVEEE